MLPKSKVFATIVDANSAERQAQHAAARLRTKLYCDIATLAWEAHLEGLVREACPSALALDWSAEVDPEVVRWQAEVHPHPLHTLDLGNFLRSRRAYCMKMNVLHAVDLCKCQHLLNTAQPT